MSIRKQVRMGVFKAIPKKWEVAENWETFEGLIRRCKDDKVDIFVSPECFLDGYVVTEQDWTEEKFTEVAQKIDDSPYIDRLRELAVSAKAYIMFGLTERVEERFYNCALIVGRDGKIEGKYYKTHLRDHDKRFAPGMELPVFELDFGLVGIVICADRVWPETIRVLRLKGAEIALVPAYGEWGLENEWRMRVRAHENEMFVCFAHPNVALIANPKGEVAAKLQSNVPDVLIQDINLDEVASSRIRDRRPDLYGILGDT